MMIIDESELVGFLEALYALELDDEAWLQQALDAMSRLCGAEYRYLGFFYDASNVADFKLWNVSRAQSVAPELESSWGIFRSLCGPAFVRSTFRSLCLGSARRTAMPYLEPVLKDRERNGWGDFFYLNGLDPSGIGCLLTLGSRDPEFRLAPNDAALFRRLAAHLGTAFRCRRRLAPSDTCSPNLGAEAALDPNESMTEAADGVTTTGSRWLASDRTTKDPAHAAKKRRAGASALEEWRPLNSARWTLLERFEEDGLRYVVARENRAETRNFYDLTDRERQIVVHASLGMSNKQIAYTLGISDATVRVLMARAAKRFGVHSRKELLAHPVMSAARG